MPVVTLTDAFLKTLKPSGDRKVSEYRDGEVHGLEIRVWASGAKSWRCHYTRRSDGRRRVVGIGSYPSVPLKEARRKAKSLQTQVEDDEKRADPAAERKARKAAVTFSDLADDWIELHGRPNKEARTLQDDISMLKRHIRPEIGAMKAAEVSKRDVIRLLDTVAAKTDARADEDSDDARRLTHRPNRVYALVRTIFRWSVSRDVLKIDPTYGLKPPIKKEKARERDLSDAEIKLLWDAFDRIPDARRSTKDLAKGERALGAADIPMTKPTALALLLSLVTAQRIGEVSGMATAELSLNDTAPIWVIPGARTKNGEPNRVPLSPLAVRLIRQAMLLAGESDWVFPNPTNDGPIDPHAPTRAMSRARERLGISDFRVHDLRRTAATGMAELGISPHTISLVLNHVSARRGTVTGKSYVQYSYDKEKREALNSWSTRVENIAAGNATSNIVPIGSCA